MHIFRHGHRCMVPFTIVDTSMLPMCTVFNFDYILDSPTASLWTAACGSRVIHKQEIRMVSLKCAVLKVSKPVTANVITHCKRSIIHNDKRTSRIRKMQGAYVCVYAYVREREWVGEWVSGWVSECVSEWVSEWLSQSISGWMGEWVSERVSEWVS